MEGIKRKCFKCENCFQSFSKISRLENHQKKKKLKCWHCKREFCNAESLEKHHRSIVKPVTQLTDLHREIQPRTGYNDAAVQAFLLGKGKEVSYYEKKGLTWRIINVPINHKYTYQNLYDWLKSIYDLVKQSFKISIGFGFVLFEPVTEKYKYFYVSENNQVLEKAYTVDSKKDLEDFMKKIQAVDLGTSCYLQKPSSGWVLCSLTNVQAKITNLKNVLLGHGKLPKYITKLKTIVNFTHLNGIPYADNLCFFRCVAFHHGLPFRGLEKYTKYLCQEFEKIRGKSFQHGVTIFDIPSFEIHFKCPVNVYNLQENGEIDLIYQSSLKFSSYDKTMYLNLHKNHFSYIKDISCYGKKYKCMKCQKICNRTDNLDRHVKKCSDEVKEIFIGGKYDAKLETVFHKLEKIGIYVDDRAYNFVSTFDFEAMQIPEVQNLHGRDTHYIHIPISVSLCTNIPGYTEPVHIQSNGSPQILVEKMISLQLKHQERASSEMRKKFYWVFEKLNEKIEISDVEMTPKLRTIQKKFEEYCDILPILSFNGQRYDLPLIRNYLPLALKKLDSLPQFVVKRDNSYMAISTNRLRFLDLTNYLAAGTSLDKFYTAFKVTFPKHPFPYEFLDSLEKLKTTSFPKRDPKLRKAMEENDTETIKKLEKLDPFYSILRQKTVPNIEIDMCEAEWQRQGMETFADFLRFYNNLDVIGLVEGIEKMSQVYHAQGLNIFKDAISLPRLTQKLIFSSLQDDYFTTFSKTHQHIYTDLRQNLTGGPSIVFTRLMGKGRIMNNDQICQKIVGYDCNSMYLWALGLAQPTGSYRLREKSQGFQKHSKKRNEKHFLQYSQKCINWLKSIEKDQNIKIRHAESNPHGEKRIENWYVDGFFQNTIYEFLGCFYHGHDCTTRFYDPIKLDETTKRIEKFQELGYEVITIWECQWQGNLYQTEPYYPITENDILQGIIENEIFGIVKCDLKVPDYLKKKFERFPPLFKNVEIPLDRKIIGDHMFDYAMSIGRTVGVKRSLISSMWAKNFVISTSLFQEYLKLGLQCTNIEWVLEYHGKPVFQWFVEKIANDRRRADLDSDLEIIGETSKTSGNAAYGYTAVDKSKYNNVYFCEQNEIEKHVTDPHFKNLEELQGGIYEVVKTKTRVVQDTPLQVAITVYSMAKYNLIKFWNFLYEHLDYNLYCLISCDTDSLYLGIARATIDECVLPEKKDDWLKKKNNFFVSDSEELVLFEGKEITRNQYEKRTPGLYKMEYEGEEMLALNSKVYHIWKYDKNGQITSKTSSKGMQKRNNLVKQDFLDVLTHKSKHRVQNAGFIREGTQTFTYTQNKSGLNYFYCKRIVLEDGITTTYLDI